MSKAVQGNDILFGHRRGEDIAAAVGAFPTWLADDVEEWIQDAEARGQRFASALEAVQAALEALNRGAAR